MAEEKSDSTHTPEPTIEKAERAVELGESVRKGIDVAPQASISADAPSPAVVPAEGTPTAADSSGGDGGGGASTDES